ncbi:hypothetical protein FRC12_018657 [Ceratobasidium sp. 428]|nr:hypothetical protein FRC12_018657 [Ceratobasidium sp. 428]
MSRGMNISHALTHAGKVLTADLGANRDQRGGLPSGRYLIRHVVYGVFVKCSSSKVFSLVPESIREGDGTAWSLVRDQVLNKYKLFSPTRDMYAADTGFGDWRRVTTKRGSYEWVIIPARNRPGHFYIKHAEKERYWGLLDSMGGNSIWLYNQTTSAETLWEFIPYAPNSLYARNSPQVGSGTELYRAETCSGCVENRQSQATITTGVSRSYSLPDGDMAAAKHNAPLHIQHSSSNSHSLVHKPLENGVYYIFNTKHRIGARVPQAADRQDIVGVRQNGSNQPGYKWRLFRDPESGDYHIYNVDFEMYAVTSVANPGSVHTGMSEAWWKLVPVSDQPNCFL